MNRDRGDIHHDRDSCKEVIDNLCKLIYIYQTYFMPSTNLRYAALSGS